MKLNAILFASLFVHGACAGMNDNGSASSATPSDPSNSEVATSVVSGALNDTAGSSVAFNSPQTHRSRFGHLIDQLNPLSTAFAATWSCSGDSLSPKFDGPGSYAYTPVSCSVTWNNGKSAGSTWSSPFALDYSSSCSDASALPGLQAGNCAITRTTSASGDTRTITGPNGDEYAITHDTNGAGTGWDSAVSPAPANGGVILTCDAAGCSQGRTIEISGSHITGTVSTAKQSDVKIWDHTVSTAQPLVVVSDGAQRTVTGTVTVQHNIIKETANVTFNNVNYADQICCFPTQGSVTAAIVDGPRAGKSETLTFSNVCGEATLVDASGATSSLTLEHCL